MAAILRDINLVEFLREMDPASRAAVAIFAMVFLLAYAFFGRRSSTKVRLSVFLTVAGLAVVTLAFMHNSAHAKADDQGQPHGASGASLLHISLTLVGLADPLPAQQNPTQSGWIFCAKYDSSKKAWGVPQNVVIEPPADHLLPRRGDRLKTLVPVDIYDDQPRYTLFEQKWRLGKIIGHLPKGTTVDAVSDAVRIGDNVWCQIRAG